MPDTPRRAPAPGPGWVLAFSDDFDGDRVDPAKWYVDPYLRADRSQKIINREPQAYVPDALSVSDSILHIRVEKREAPYAGKILPYTSGLLTTRFGGFTQRYGYFEIRCRMSRAIGTWPAFWLMPDPGAPEGAYSSEVDIMEFWPRQGERYSVAIHWGGYGAGHRCDQHWHALPGLSDEFHDYGAELTPDEMIFYCDGVEVHRVGGEAVTRQPMCVIVNCALSPEHVDDAALPDVFDVDRARVWRREDA